MRLSIPWLFVLAACTDAKDVVDDNATAIEISVAIDPALGVDQLRIAGHRGPLEAFAPGQLPETPRALAATETMAILLAPELGGAMVLVRIDGLAGGSVVASGGAVVAVVANDVVDTQITLREPAVCGDAVVHPEVETCDDADSSADDGCSADCLVEDGWTCVPGPTASICTEIACRDGLDNDGDGVADADDPGCTDPNDTDERGTAACDNGVDDDGDGQRDEQDLNCSDSSDTSEHCTGAGCRACEDGIDNDGDGFTDFRLDGGRDPGCGSLSDNAETCSGGTCPQCDNSLDDNDPEDTLIDMLDPGCSGPTDDNEVDGA